jgi:hypothetical protein
MAAAAIMTAAAATVRRTAQQATARRTVSCLLPEIGAIFHNEACLWSHDTYVTFRRCYGNLWTTQQRRFHQVSAEWVLLVLRLLRSKFTHARPASPTPTPKALRFPFTDSELDRPMPISACRRTPPRRASRALGPARQFRRRRAAMTRPAAAPLPTTRWRMCTSASATISRRCWSVWLG